MGKRIILAGGSGFLGRALAEELIEKNYDVVILSRFFQKGQGKIKYQEWNGKTLGDWVNYLEGALAVVNLTGKSVNCRYTPKNRREIVESRTHSAQVIGKAILQCKNPPKVWVQTSSLAIYGDAGDKICDENTPLGEGFSPNVCIEWESMIKEIKILLTRKVILRIGLVLGHKGGVLEPFVNITKWFLGGTIGTGKQYLSWIHVKDMNHIFLNCIEREDYEGIFNVTSPHPVTNAEFMRELRRAIGRPWSPPTPSWMVRMGTRILGTESELVLTGRRGNPARLLQKGFQFEYPYFKGALDDLLEKSQN